MDPRYPDDRERLERAIAESRRLRADAELFLAAYAWPSNEHPLDLASLRGLRYVPSRAPTEPRAAPDAGHRAGDACDRPKKNRATRPA